MLTWIEREVLDPVSLGLDRARARVLGWLAPLVRPFVRSRDLRVQVLAGLSVTLALVASVAATGYLLLLGPLIFGAAHLLAEGRILLPVERRNNPVVMGLLAVQVALVLAGVGVVALPWVSALAMLSLARGRIRWIAFGVLVLLGIGALVGPTVSRFAFLHVHNLVPLFVWATARRRSWKTSLAVIAWVVCALGLVMGGAFDAVPLRTPLSDNVFSLVHLNDAVAGAFGGVYRKRWLVVFAFTQSFHYGAWLRLVPEETRPRETPRGFGASYAALRADFGKTPALLGMLATVAIPLAAVAFGAVRVRSLYVTASEFHASVEALLVLVALVAPVSRRGAFATR